MRTHTIALAFLLAPAATRASGALVTYRIEGRVGSIDYLTDGQFSDLGLGGSVAIELVFDDASAPITTEDSTSTWAYRTDLSRFEIGNHAYTPEDLEGWNSFSFSNGPGETGDRLVVNGQITEKDVPGNFFLQIDLGAGFVAGDSSPLLTDLTAGVIDPVSSAGYFNIGNPSSGVALGWEATSMYRVPGPSGLAVLGVGLLAPRRRR